MKKLTIEHLAAYLPYGVKVIPTFGGYAILDVDNIGRVLESDKPRKLILHPLSDLTREITHNGETFVPLMEVKRLHSSAYSYYASLPPSDSDFLPYCIAQLLLSWHFDIFELLSDNLAIDINTLAK